MKEFIMLFCWILSAACVAILLTSCAPTRALVKDCHPLVKDFQDCEYLEKL